jgi:HEAT repeat protein
VEAPAVDAPAAEAAAVEAPAVEAPAVEARADAAAADAAAAEASVAEVLVSEAPAAAEQASAEPPPAAALPRDEEVSTDESVLEAEPLPPPAPSVESHPLAERLPEAVERLVGPAHRELFARLITSSEPWTLRRLLEPVQVAIEQTARAGAVADSARLLVAMFACEACADDTEMRRQFVVTLRRLTKPTLTRAYAMLYATAAEHRAELEQVLARFGEDGAEAVADCIGNAGSQETLALYTDLLGRLPGANDALIAMLDDQRDQVVERALGLVVALRHPDMERVLGDALGHKSPRVRRAAARGLTAARDSAFAADALLRAVQDASPDVRLIGAVGLQARREERLVSSLLPLLDAEEELDVQLALLGVLGKIVTAEGVQRLIALANPSERMMRRRRMPVLRLSAIELLGEARTPAAMAALQKLLEDTNKEVREAAARLYTRARRQTAAMGVASVTDA